MKEDKNILEHLIGKWIWCPDWTDNLACKVKEISYRNGRHVVTTDYFIDDEHYYTANGDEWTTYQMASARVLSLRDVRTMLMSFSEKDKFQRDHPDDSVGGVDQQVVSVKVITEEVVSSIELPKRQKSLI